MAIDPSVPRPRRALLAAAAGSLGALVASAVARVAPARAASGDPLIVGAANSGGTSQTVLTNAGLGASFTLKTTNTAAGAAGIFGWSSSTAAGATRGVYGRADGPNSSAVEGRHFGSAGTGAAIHAVGGNNVAVDASSSASGFAYPTVRATNDASTGAVAVHAQVSGEESFAVRGIADGATGSSAGVYGRSASDGGIGVHGQALSLTGLTWGVLGQSSSATGIGGAFSGQVGVYAETTTGGGLGGQFVGGIQVYGHHELMTSSDPDAANGAKLYVRDVGGKKELCVLFPTGEPQVIAAEV